MSYYLLFSILPLSSLPSLFPSALFSLLFTILLRLFAFLASLVSYFYFLYSFVIPSSYPLFSFLSLRFCPSVHQVSSILFQSPPLAIPRCRASHDLPCSFASLPIHSSHVARPDLGKHPLYLSIHVHFPFHPVPPSLNPLSLTPASAPPHPVPFRLAP